MHILSSHHRDEFLAVPQLVRLTMANGKNGSEATLLLKADTLTLKQLMGLRCFEVFFIRIKRKILVYGIRINDDADHPVMLWSPVESQDEINAIRVLIEQPSCVVFLFNELAVNVAWGDTAIYFQEGDIKNITDDVEFPAVQPGRAISKEISEEVSEKLELWYQQTALPDGAYASKICKVSEWHEIQNYFVTNRAETGLISIFDLDEGGQQEEIAHWLMDALKLDGAVKSPQVHEAGKVRELCDVLISHEYSAILVESKTLNLSARENLPNRGKLSRDIRKHIQKAIGQLVGAVKNLKRGLPVTDQKGRDVEVNREMPPHVIILVPDLTLLNDAVEFGGKFLAENSLEANAYFHILDPVELLRMVQAAGMIAKRGKTTTMMMAFDAHILTRFKQAIKLDTPDFDFLVRFSPDAEGKSSEEG